MSINDKILELIVDDEDITWQAILTNLVKAEGLNMWDLDIFELSDKFIDAVKRLKEMDFRISGKIVLAAAILLRMKSVYLVTDGINNFDRMFDTSDDDEETDDIDYAAEAERKRINASLKDFGIVPRTPLPRKRKVSIYDLIDALQKTIESKNKKVTRLINTSDNTRFKKLMESKIDITVVIHSIYNKLLEVLDKDDAELTFETLLFMDKKEVDKKGKVHTFLPLLHLETTDKILLSQNETFGDITIRLKRDSN